MGQRVAHVPRQPVDEVVLASVGLVGDDYNVAAIRKRFIPASWRNITLTPGRLPEVEGRCAEIVRKISNGSAKTRSF